MKKTESFSCHHLTLLPWTRPAFCCKQSQDREAVRKIGLLRIQLQQTRSGREVCLQSCVCQRETRCGWCHPPALLSVRVSLVQHAFVPAGGVESAPVKTIENSTAASGKVRGRQTMSRAPGVEMLKHKPSRLYSVLGAEPGLSAQVRTRGARCAQRERLSSLHQVFSAGPEQNIATMHVRVI